MTILELMRIMQAAMNVVTVLLLLPVIWWKLWGLDFFDIIFRCGVAMLAGGGAWAAYELAAKNVPPGPRGIMLSVGSLWMLVGIVGIFIKTPKKQIPKRKALRMSDKEKEVEHTAPTEPVDWPVLAAERKRLSERRGKTKDGKESKLARE